MLQSSYGKKASDSNKYIAYKITGILLLVAWIIISVVNQFDNIFLIVLPLILGALLIVLGYIKNRNYGKYKAAAFLVGTALVTLLGYLVFLLVNFVNFAR
jgi:RsiW-degrading membrane proteinase PrsW (M82 family)